MRKNKYKHITWDDISIYKGLPNRKKAILTNEFLQTFKDELISIFTEDDVKQGREPLDYANKTYYGFYDGIEVSSGFYKALKIACEKHNLTKAIYKYENNMAWYDSDMFDSDLTELMVERGIIEKGNYSELYGDDSSKDEMTAYKLVKRFKVYNVVEYKWCSNDDIDFIKKLYKDSDKELIWV